MDQQAEYRWVKLEVEALRGTHLTFEQTRVNDEVWLPSHESIHAAWTLPVDVEITYRDYKKFQSNSHIVTDDDKK